MAKAKAKKTTVKSYGVDEVKRYLGALHEDHKAALKMVGEQYFDIKKELDSHTEMIGQLMIDVSEIKYELTQKVNRVEFARLEKRVLKLENSRR